MTFSETLRERVRQLEAEPARRSPTPASPPPLQEPYTVHGHLAAHAPFVPAEICEALADFKRKYDAFSAQMAAADEKSANAEFERRVTSARNDPSAENLAVLNGESADELRRKFRQRWDLFEGLRSETVHRLSPGLSRQILDIITPIVAQFRAQCEAEFREVHHRWGVPYHAERNEALRPIDQWLYRNEQLLTVAERAKEDRYPSGWQGGLATPDGLIAAVAGNLTPAPAALPDTAIKTSAQVAAARAG